MHAAACIRPRPLRWPHKENSNMPARPPQTCMRACRVLLIRVPSAKKLRLTPGPSLATCAKGACRTAEQLLQQNSFCSRTASAKRCGLGCVRLPTHAEGPGTISRELRPQRPYRRCGRAAPARCRSCTCHLPGGQRTPLRRQTGGTCMAGQRITFGSGIQQK